MIGWDAVSFAGAALLVSRLAPSCRTGDRSADGFLRQLSCGWRDFRSRRWLWVLVLQSAVVVPLWLIGYQVLGPVYAQRELGGVAGWGLVAAGFAGGWWPDRPSACGGSRSGWVR